MPSYQDQLVQVLAVAFPEAPVKKEWAALSGEEAVYSPRIDIAVGPFASGAHRFEAEFSDMLERHLVLLRRLHGHFQANAASVDPAELVPDLVSMGRRNPNARCFIALEIEASGSRKHIMGGAVNAAALGRIGISVACSAERLRALLKMRRYLLFLAEVGKNTFDPRNLMILAKEQLDEALEGLP